MGALALRYRLTVNLITYQNEEDNIDNPTVITQENETEDGPELMIEFDTFSLPKAKLMFKEMKNIIIEEV